MNITKRFYHAIGTIALMLVLVACSSPEEKASAYIKNGSELFQAGDMKKAEIEYKNALQINQNLPDAWYGLAEIYESKAEWNRSFGALTKIRELAPQHLDGRIKLGQLLLTSSQLDQALVDAAELIEMAPDDARVHTLMAAIQFQLDNLDGAREAVNRALELDTNSGDALLVRARIFIAEKRYNEALALLDNAIKSNPQNSAFYLVKIEANQKLGDSEAVEKVLLALVEQFPDEARYLRALSRHYLSEENIDATERTLNQVVEVEPDNIDSKKQLVAFKRQNRSLDDAIALVSSFINSDKSDYRYRFMLGELYESNQQNEKAMEIYEGVIADDGTQPNGLEARGKIALIEARTGNRDRAQKLVAEVLAEDGTNESALLIRAGFQLTEGEVDDAIVSIRTVLRDFPKSTRALALLGEAYIASGSQSLAIETYYDAFQINPGTPLIANKLAALLMTERKVTQADEVLQQSFNSGNRSVEALKLLTQVKLALGEWDKAEQLATQLHKFKGQEAISLQLLGVAYQGKNQPGASIDAFKRAHELVPDSLQPVVALVRTYISSGETDKAYEFLDSILKLDNNNITALMLLGQLKLAEGANTDAIKHFSTVIEIDPKNVSAYRRLALVYAQQNQRDKAAEVIKKAIIEVPEDTALLIHLASIHEKNGEIDEAIETYQAVLEKDSEALIARNNLASLLVEFRGDQASLEKATSIAAVFRDSRVPQFRDTYAWAAVMSGVNIEEAIVILEGLVREDDKVEYYAYHLGEAYRRTGDSANAIIYLQKARKLSPPGSEISTKAKQALDLIL